MKFAYLDSQLTGRSAQRRKLANNTYAERRPDGSIAIRLHSTDIAAFQPDGRIIARSGGYRTPVTKDRLNQFLPSPVWQKAGRWFIGSSGSTFEFEDGITFHPDGKITGAKSPGSADREKALQKRIKVYCEGLTKALPLAKPDSGDCWYCLLREQQTGKPLEELTDTKHLESHMDEKYYVPSLVWRALEAAGYKPDGGGCTWFWYTFGASPLDEYSRKRIAGFVKKYLRRQFGLA